MKDKLPRVCTKRGDSGQTDLNPKVRIYKGEAVLDLLGDIDELISYLGVCQSKSLQKFSVIQKQLYLMMSVISRYKDTSCLEDILFCFENYLKEYKNIKLNSFVFPDTHLDYARAICRRAERSFWKFIQGIHNQDTLLIGKILNRLSDLLFLMAREVSSNKELKNDTKRSK